MSKLDYLTIAIVAICVIAVTVIMVKVIDLGKIDNPLTTPQEETTASAEKRSDEPTDQSEPAPKSYEEDPGRTDFDWDAEDEEIQAPIEENIPAEAYQAPETQKSSSAGSGDFLVLAGSFRLRAGAEAEVRKLRELGYRNAEVTLFNNGTFAAVLVDRFSDIDAANQLAQTLKNKHNVEAYVHERRVGQ